MGLFLELTQARASDIECLVNLGIERFREVVQEDNFLKQFKKRLSYEPYSIKGPQLKALLPNMENYYRVQKALGRPPLYVIQDIVNVLRRVYHSNLSPALLNQALDAASHSTKHITNLIDQFENSQYFYQQLHSFSNRTEITSVISHFRSQPVPIISLSAENFLRVKLTILLEELHTRSGGAPSKHAMLFTVSNLTHNLLSTKGIFTPYPNEFGIRVVNDIYTIGYTGLLIHEMAHAVQYNHWDYMKIVDHYLTHVSPKFKWSKRFKNMIPQFINDHDENTARLIKSFLEGGTLNRANGKEVINYIELTQFDSMDWFHLSNYITFLKEVHAFYVNGIFDVLDDPFLSQLNVNDNPIKFISKKGIHSFEFHDNRLKRILQQWYHNEIPGLNKFDILDAIELIKTL